MVRSSTTSLWGGLFTQSLVIQCEAEKYLAEPCTAHPENNGPNTLTYWRSMRAIYPNLSRMALDYLGIQGSATPVECVWSSALDTDTKKQNRLLPEHLEVLQFLKAAYRKLRMKAMTTEEHNALAAARRDLFSDMNWEDDIVTKVDIGEEELFACLEHSRHIQS